MRSKWRGVGGVATFLLLAGPGLGQEMKWAASDPNSRTTPFFVDLTEQQSALDNEIRRAIELDRQGRYTEAETVLRAVLKQAERLPEDDPRLAASVGSLAVVCEDLGKIMEAERLHRWSISLLEKSHGRRHPMLSGPLRNLAGLYVEQGQLGQAERLLNRVLALENATAGPGEIERAYNLLLLGSVLFARERYTDAEPPLRQAASILEWSAPQK